LFLKIYLFLGLVYDGLDSAYALWSRESESSNSSCEASNGLKGQGLHTYWCWCCILLHVFLPVRDLFWVSQKKNQVFSSLVWTDPMLCFCHVCLSNGSELLQIIELNKQFQVRIQWPAIETWTLMNNGSECLCMCSAKQPFLFYHSGSTAKVKKSIPTLKNCLQQCKESVKNPFKPWRTIWSDPSAASLVCSTSHITITITSATVVQHEEERLHLLLLQDCHYS
jgi:hypothetical protein